MIIPVIRAFLLFSLMALLGSHARTLPEDLFKMSNIYHGRTSTGGRPSGPSEHPSPQVDPPHHNVISISFGTGSLRNMITRPSQAPPPPPLPNTGPPRIQTIPTVPQRVLAYSDNQVEKFKWLSPVQSIF